MFHVHLTDAFLKTAILVSLLSAWGFVGLFHYLNRHTRRDSFTIQPGAQAPGQEPEHHSEELLRLRTKALEATTSGVMITNRAGIIQWVNPGFTGRTGFSPHEAVGKTHRMFKSEERDAAFYKNLWLTLLEGKSWEGIFTTRRKDGTPFQSAHSITPVRDATGQIRILSVS